MGGIYLYKNIKQK